MSGDNKKIRILQIPSGGLFCDGIFHCITSYLNAMDQTGIEVDILAVNKLTEAMDKKIAEFGCNVIQAPSRKKNLISYFRFVLSCMGQYDIIQVHGSSSIMAIELLAAKLCGCKVRIAHSHNTTCDHKLFHYALLPLFRLLYTDAFACGQMAGKWLFGKKDYTVIPNGRSIQKFRYSAQARAAMRAWYGLEDQIVIGHVGGFNPQKNHVFLIDVFNEILKTTPNAKLMLMGTGWLMKNVREQAERLGIEQNIIFAGHIDNVAEMLSAMDVMMLPSIHEGLPLVVLEWQMSGLPCLVSNKVTDECKATELIQFLPIDQGAKTWANAFSRLSFAHDRAAVSERACESMRAAHFDIEENAEQLRSMYCQMVNRC